MGSSGNDNPREWIRCDESAAEMLARCGVERLPLLLPPLHRVPLRPGNVVEIVGPSPSAKSEILIQAAISCILPRESNGIHFGGMERLVVYFDLDCRFCVHRLAHCLKDRLAKAAGHYVQNYAGGAEESIKYNDELFQMCMKRFLYIRCYNSLEFLDALKTMFCHVQRESEEQGIGVYFLMIDSINAFYWMDRACQPPPSGSSKGKCLSLQTIMQAVVQDIQRFLQAQKAIVLATKSAILGLEVSNDSQRGTLGRPFEDVTDVNVLRGESGKYSYREFMPLAWQVFVSHRMLIRVSENLGGLNPPIYASEWVLPPLDMQDIFTVTDVGIVLIP